jgi:hypothetical protein
MYERYCLIIERYTLEYQTKISSEIRQGNKLNKIKMCINRRCIKMSGKIKKTKQNI